MTDWLPIRIKTEPAKLRYVKSRIMGYPEEAMGKYFFQQLQMVTASAADVMKNFIMQDKNTKKYETTGVKGRRKTGAMIDAITWRGSKIGKGKYRFEFGWLDGRPGYAIFQEQGTKNGVRALNSLDYATNFAKQELRLLGQNPAAFRATRASRWGGRD